MHRKSITAAAAAAGILAAVLGQQTQTSAAVAAHSVEAIHSVLTAHDVAAAGPGPLSTTCSGSGGNTGCSTDTSLTFIVGSAGELSLSAPATANLGTGLPNLTSTAVSIGDVTVTDDRASSGTGTGTWTVTAASTNLLRTGGTETIPANNINYNPNLNAIVKEPATASVSVTGTAGKLTTSGITVMSATGGSTGESVRWNPSMSIDVPAGQVPGTYTGTLTHSVA